MPLYSKNRQCFVCDGLNCTVIRAGKRPKPPAKLLYALVMCAVDGKACTIQLAQQSRRTVHRMKCVLPANLTVPFHVLAQCAAPKNIDELKPPADADDRLPRTQKAAHQQKLAFIPRFVYAGCAVDRLRIKARVNIAAARKQQNLRLFRHFRKRCADKCECIFVIFQAYR